jgi:hypothetical protein
MAEKIPSAEDLIERVASRVDRTPQSKPWWMRLSDEQVAQISPLREAYVAGRFGAREITACRAISSVLNELGIVIGAQGVKAWLRAKT